MKYSVMIDLILIFFTFHATARADEYRLQFFADSDSKKINPDLMWDESKETREPVLQIREKDQQGPRYFVELRGQYLKKEISLLFGDRAIPFGNDGKFKIEVGIEAPQNEVVLSKIGKEGDLERYSWELSFPEWDKFQASLMPSPSKRWSLTTGVEASYLAYKQADTSLPKPTNFSQLAMEFYGGGSYFLMENLTLQGNVLLTLLPLYSTQSGSTMRLFSGNLGAILKLPFLVRDFWSLKIRGGYSYRTSFPSSSTFGYFNLQGIAVYPQLEKTFSQGQLAWAYARFLPLSNGGLNFLSLSNFELTVGGGYQFKELKDGKWLSANFDLSFLSLQYFGDFSGTIQTNSYNVGVSYVF
jgi:hypothetical protein